MILLMMNIVVGDLVQAVHMEQRVIIAKSRKTRLRESLSANFRDTIDPCETRLR